LRFEKRSSNQVVGSSNLSGRGSIPVPSCCRRARDLHHCGGDLFHSNFADQNQAIHFLKNFAIAGGLLQVAAVGAGRWSLDVRRSANFRPVDTAPASP